MKGELRRWWLGIKSPWEGVVLRLVRLFPRSRLDLEYNERHHEDYKVVIELPVVFRFVPRFIPLRSGHFSPKINCAELLAVYIEEYQKSGNIVLRPRGFCFKMVQQDRAHSRLVNSPSPRMILANRYRWRLAIDFWQKTWSGFQEFLVSISGTKKAIRKLDSWISDGRTGMNWRIRCGPWIDRPVCQSAVIAPRDIFLLV